MSKLYVETVSNNTGKLCIHILFVHRKNTTFTGCKPFFISLFVYKTYFKKKVIRLDYEDNIQLVKKETMKYLKTSMLDSVLESQTTKTIKSGWRTGFLYHQQLPKSIYE